MKQQSFLLITYAFVPTDVVGALRPFRICRYVQEYGWTPEVLTVRPKQEKKLHREVAASLPDSMHIHYTTDFDLANLFRNLKQGFSGKSTGPGTKTGSNQMQISDPCLNYKKSPPRRVLNRIRAGLKGMLKTPDRRVAWGVIFFVKGFRLLMRKNNAIRFVFTTSPPHSSQVFGCLLARAFSKPHVADLRDPWTDVYRGYQSPARRYLEQRLERWITEHSACVISSTDTYSELLRQRYPDQPITKFQTVTNSFEEKKFEQIEPVQTTKFTIVYLGIFYPRRNPYCFFQALGLWLERNPRIQGQVEFRIVGECDPVTRQMIDRYRIASVMNITGRLPQEQAIAMTKGADLLLLAAGTGEDTPRGWVPSKLYEYLACGKPILANIPEGSASDIIRKTHSGYLIHESDPEKMVRILDQEYHRKDGGSPAEAAHQFAPDMDEIRKYGTRACIRQFVDIFNSLVDKDQPHA